MIEWLPAPPTLSDQARQYRGLWAGRWPGTSPFKGEQIDLETRHAPLQHGFRSPLSWRDESRAEAEYFTSVARHLAAGRLVAVHTFEFRVANWPDPNVEEAPVLGADRELWLQTREFDGEDEIIMSAFLTVMEGDDPRIIQLYRDEHPVITDLDLRWVASHHDDNCSVLSTSDPSLFDAHQEARATVRRRWGLDLPRFPRVDLRLLNDEIERQWTGWRERGFEGRTYFRTWPEEQHIDMVDEIPSDVTTIDALVLNLSSESSHAALWVGDSGFFDLQCSRRLQDNDDDLEAECEFDLEWSGLLALVDEFDLSIRLRPERPVSADLLDLFSCLDRVADFLDPADDPRPDGR